MAEKFTVSLQKIINNLSLNQFILQNRLKKYLLMKTTLIVPVFSLWDFMNILIPNEYKL